jgi:hypothetical protein
MTAPLKPARDPRAEKAKDFRRQYGHRRWPRMADFKRRRAAKLAARRGGPS